MPISKFVLSSALTAMFAVSTLTVMADERVGNSSGTQTSRPSNYKPTIGDEKLGKRLWKDAKLSTNGLSCNTCHAKHGAFQASFGLPYPHTVKMAKDQLGRNEVHLDEMIQACMIMPMEAKSLPWNSKELAALVAYTQRVQKTFKPSVTSSK